MSATAANLIERVLPQQSGLRQWVLTFPFPWRRRLAQDGALLGKLTRIFVETVHAFYAERAAREGALGATTGAVTVGQRTSSDLRLNPHLHLVALDGAWDEEGGELCWQGLGHLQTSEVGAVLESTVRRIERQLGRRGLLGIDRRAGRRCSATCCVLRWRRSGWSALMGCYADGTVAVDMDPLSLLRRLATSKKACCHRVGTPSAGRDAWHGRVYGGRPFLPTAGARSLVAPTHLSSSHSMGIAPNSSVANSTESRAHRVAPRMGCAGRRVATRRVSQGRRAIGSLVYYNTRSPKTRHSRAD